MGSRELHAGGCGSDTLGSAALELDWASLGIRVGTRPRLTIPSGPLAGGDTCLPTQMQEIRREAVQHGVDRSRSAWLGVLWRSHCPSGGCQAPAATILGLLAEFWLEPSAGILVTLGQQCGQIQGPGVFPAFFRDVCFGAFRLQCSKSELLSCPRDLGRVFSCVSFPWKPTTDPACKSVFWCWVNFGHKSS